MASVRRGLSVGTFALMLSSCGSAATATSDQQGSSQVKVVAPYLDGFGGLKFGDTLRGAVSRVGADRFNPISLKKCFEDLPLKGCFLSAHPEAEPFTVVDGIPYRLALEFNAADRLTDLSLEYRRMGDVTPDQCLSVHERTLDWLSRRFGQLHPTLRGSEEMEKRTTPGGQSYFVYRASGKHFTTSPQRTASKSLDTETQKKWVTDWNDQRYVSLSSDFIVTPTRPHCDVRIGFKEPQNVSRRLTE